MTLSPRYVHAPSTYALDGNWCWFYSDFCHDSFKPAISLNWQSLVILLALHLHLCNLHWRIWDSRPNYKVKPFTWPMWTEVCWRMSFRSESPRVHHSHYGFYHPGVVDHRSCLGWFLSKRDNQCIFFPYRSNFKTFNRFTTLWIRTSYSSMCNLTLASTARSSHISVKDSRALLFHPVKRFLLERSAMFFWPKEPWRR